MKKFFLISYCLSLSVPSRVSSVSLTKTVASGIAALRVNWTTPQSDVNISQYQVEYRKSVTIVWDSRLTISGSPPATSTTLTGLEAGTEYSVRVRAVSAIGTGEWSVVQTERTFCCKSEVHCQQLWVHRWLPILKFTIQISLWKNNVHFSHSSLWFGHNFQTFQ